MRLLGLEGVRRTKGVRTTIQAKDGRRAGDLLNRDFTAPRPDHTWVADFVRREALVFRMEVRDLHRLAVVAAG